MSRRKLAVWGGIFLVLVLTAWLAARLPRAAADWAFTALERNLAITGRVESVALNPFTLVIRLRGVSLWTTGHEREPFLTVEAVTVDMPWAAVLAEPAIDLIDAVAPVVSVRRAADGTTNLPDFGRDPSPSAPVANEPWRLGVVALRGGAVSVVDESTALRVTVDPVDLRLDPDLDPNDVDGAPRISGVLTLDRSTTVSWGSQETAIEPLTVALGFDGSTLTIGDLEMVTPEARLRVDGDLVVAGGDPGVALDYRVDADLDLLSTWVPEATWGGAFVASGRLDGSAADPRGTAVVEAPLLRWNAFEARAVRLEAALADRTVTLSQLAAEIAGGAVSGAGVATFLDAVDAPQTRGELDLDWTDIDADLLATTMGVALPSPAASHLTGTLRASWPDHDPRQWVVAVESQLRPHTGVSTGLGGRLRAATETGQWRVDVDALTMSSASVTGQLTGAVPPSAAGLPSMDLQGAVEAQVSDLRQLAADLESLGIAGPPQASLSGAASLTLAIAGTPEAPRLAGVLEARGRALDSDDPFALDTSFSLDTERWRLESVDLQIAGSRSTGAVSMDAVSRQVEGRVGITVPDLRTFEARVPVGWRPAGAVELDGVISGQWPTPKLDATLDARALVLAGQRAQAVQGHLTLTPTELVINDLTASQDDDGRLQMEGRLGTDGGYTVSVRGRGVQLSPWLPESEDRFPVEAKVDLDVTGEGTLDAPRASGRIVLHNPVFDGYTVDRLEQDVVIAPEGWRLRAVVPSLSASMDLELRPADEWRYEMRAALGQADLTQLGALAGWDPARASGTVGLSLQATGSATDLGASTVVVDLQHLDARITEVPVRLQRPVELRYGAGELAVSDLDLRVDETRVTGAGLLGDVTGSGAGLRLTATGDLGDLGRLVGNGVAAGADGRSRATTLSGSFQLELAATGSVVEPTVTASLVLDDAGVSSTGMPPLSEIFLRADLGTAGLRVEELRGRFAEARLTATGLIPAPLLAPWLPDWATANGVGDPAASSGRAVVTARVEGLTPSALAGVVDPDTLEGLVGTVAVTVDLQADRLALDALQGTLQLDTLDLELGGLPVTQQRPTRFVLDAGRIGVDGFAWQIGDAATTVTLGGGITLTPVPSADLTLSATADLRVINAFTDGVALGGNATLLADLGGTLAEPRLDGVIELDQVELRVSDPRLLVSGLSGALVFQGTEMRMVEVAGTANGGPVAMEGVIRFAGFQPEGEVSLTGDSIAMVLPPGVRTEIDTDVVLLVEPEEAVLSGTVALVRGDYREPITAAGGLLAALESRPPPALVAGDPSWLERLRLDLRVLTEEELLVNNNYGVGTLGADMRVRGTVARPALTGRATVGDGGQVFLGGNTFEIESARVDFIDPEGIVPEIDATARTRVGDEEITITFEGTAETLTTTMETASGLPESDIVSLLLTGRTLDEAGSAPGRVARDQALGLVSGEALGVAGRTVGLDTVRLDRGLDVSLVASETNPGTRVTVGKNLNRQTELVASQSLRGSGLLTWIVNYVPRRNVELRLVIDDQTDRAYEFRHAVSFGGERVRATRSVERVQPRVTAIELSGAMGLAEPDVRRLLQLEAGQPFDFLGWQDSRDRIERALWDRGYQEARIRTDRTLGEDGATIALGLDIDAGPLCVVDVRGYSVPASLVEEIEETWRGSVFDGFLLDEVAAIARRWFAGEGYPRSEVTATIEATDEGDQKRIRLDLASGPRVRDRVIRFSGNNVLSDDTLAALVTPELEADVWAGGTMLVDRLQDVYRSQGWLEAAARLDPVRVDGETAVLAVELVEGPPFVVSGVVVAGVVAWGAEQVVEVAGVEPGVVFTANLGEVVRTRVLVAYRRAGFNAARVRVEASVTDQDGQVALRLVVDEGRRQLLRDVQVVGGEQTHAGLIDRALQLTSGTPVDQAAWNLARKRLYDTGVFRSVDIVAVPLAKTPASGDTVPADEPVTAQVTLESWPLYQLRYGLQVIDERVPAGEIRTRGQFGAVADLTRRNLFGRAVSVGASVRSDTVQQAVRGFMSIPSFFGRDVTSNLFVSRLRETLGSERDILSDRHRLTLEQQIRPAEGMTFSYSYNLERNHTFEKDLDPAAPFSFDLTVDIARLNTSVVLERRDDVLDATRGWFHASTLLWGVESLGSDLRFLKYVGQHYYFRPLAGGLVLASAARVGLGVGFGQELIPSERFFAGGGNTVRGYSQDSLGPISFFGDVTGGQASLILNQEVRLPIWRLVRGVGFIDAGNVFDGVGDLSLTALKVALGLGVRAETPVGLFRLDYGVPLSRSQNDPRGRWFASLGQAF